MSSFGLHSIQISHEHFGVHGEHGAEHDSQMVALGEYMHMSDKKIFLMLAFFALFLATFLDPLHGLRERLLIHAVRRLISVREKNTELYHFFGYIMLCIKRGILHTKVH
jgi:hypothetical protein